MSINTSNKVLVSQGGMPFNATLANLPVSDPTKALIDDQIASGAVTEASNYNVRCLNINPYFELKDVDYDNYATFADTGNRIITTKAAHNSRYGLQVTNAGGTLLGTKSIMPVTNCELRVTVVYRWALFGPDIDPAKTYAQRRYFGVKCFDASGSFVAYDQVYANPASQTTLAAPVNDGDTTITINTPPTAWYQDGTSDINHQKSFRMFKPDQFGNQVYTDTTSGITYNPWGYSKWNGYYGYLDYTDNGDGTTTVTLRFPWSLGSFAVGDGVLNSKGGGTYQYWLSGNTPDHPNPTTDGKWSEWVTQSSAWQYLDGEALSTDTKFRKATASAILMLLPNYRLYIDDVITSPVVGSIEYKTQYATIALEWRPAP